MAIINKEIAYMALPMSIRRGNPFPVDEYSVWYDMEELNAYATTSPVAYVGQVLVYVDESASTVEAYVIQNTAGTLTKLATTTASGDLTQDVQELQGKVSALETSVGTKGGDSTVTATNLWAAIDEIVAAYKAADSAINTNLSTNYYDKTATDNQIDSKIATAISSTYKPAGSSTFESLPEPSATIEGNVYNITDEFTAGENFVESEVGNTYPAGTNIVCIEESDSVFKYDVLSSFIDTSNLATTTQLTEGLNKKVDKVAGSSLVQDTLIDKLSGLANIKGVSSELVIDPESGELSVVAVDNSKVTGLSGLLDQKVNVQSGYSLVENTLITKLSGLATINGVSSDFTINPEGKILTIQAVDSSKVTGLSDLLASKVENIQVNGTLIENTGGTVNIPLAGSGTAGAVVGNASENKVSVGADGTMEVNSLNINKLVQTAGDVLVLDGGDASDLAAD